MWPVIRSPLRDSVGANAAQQVRHRFRIAQRAKKSLDSRAAKTRKEVLQVHPQDHAPPNMWSRKCFDRAPLQEPMDSGMRRNLLQNPAQNPSLQFLQPWLRNFNQPYAARRLRQNTIVIVPQSLAPAAQPLRSANQSSSSGVISSQAAKSPADSIVG